MRVVFEDSLLFPIGLYNLLLASILHLSIYLSHTNIVLKVIHSHPNTSEYMAQIRNQSEITANSKGAVFDLYIIPINICTDNVCPLVSPYFPLVHACHDSIYPIVICMDIIVPVLPDCAGWDTGGDGVDWARARDKGGSVVLHCIDVHRDAVVTSSTIVISVKSIVVGEECGVCDVTVVSDSGFETGCLAGHT